MSAFDEIDSSTAAPRSAIKPFFTVKTEDDEAVTRWVKNAFNALKEAESERTQLVQENIELYKGVQDNRREAKPRTMEPEVAPNYRRRREKLQVNYMFDMTENQIARITRYKPAIAVLPTTDDFLSKLGAPIAKMVIDNVWYDNSVDELLREFHRRRKVCGESFIYVKWDEHKGDIHPAQQQANESGTQLPMLDERGNPVVDENNQPKMISDPVHIGDVAYEKIMTQNVFWDPQYSWEETPWVLIRRKRDVDVLRAEYPGVAQKIVATTDDTIEQPHTKEFLNRSQVWELIHKPTRFMPKGFMCLLTPTAMLEKGDFKYEHKMMPLIRGTDIDAPDETPRGISNYVNTKGLQYQYNNLSTMILQNQALMSYPKWMMPKGACKIESLGNDRTVVQFTGPTAPALVQSSPTPGEVFKFREGLLAEMRQLNGGNTTDRGTPPPGITAGVALQFLSEQEQERFNVDVAKHNRAVVQLAQLTIQTAGQFYDDDDGRLVKVIGKDNAINSKDYKMEYLTQTYDIRIQNSNALPESKAARTQTIIDLNTEFPGMFSNEQVIELLDLGETQKFTDLATAAVRSAEAENEALQSGEQVPEPVAFEYHIQHWRVHVQQTQMHSFKTSPQTVQQGFINHILGTEMLMCEQAKKNPAFAQQVSALPMFPMFFTPDVQQAGAVGIAPGNASLEASQPRPNPMMGGPAPDDNVQQPTGAALPPPAMNPGEPVGGPPPSLALTPTHAK